MRFHHMDIPYYYLSIHWVMDIWGRSFVCWFFLCVFFFPFWLLTVLWRRFTYTPLCKHVFIFFRYIPGSGIAESHCKTMFNFLGNFQSFPKGLYHSTSPLAVFEDFSISSPKLVTNICLFYSSHPSGYKVISLCSFDWHFSNGLLVIFSHAFWPFYTFFGEISVQIFAHF